MENVIKKLLKELKDNARDVLDFMLAVTGLVGIFLTAVFILAAPYLLCAASGYYCWLWFYAIYALLGLLLYRIVL